MKKLNDTLNTFFKGGFWKSKKALWIGIPILIWIVGMGSYVYVIRAVKAKKQVKGASVAVNLQEDINFISAQAKSAQILPTLSKEELLKSDREDNFLEKKIKRNLERSDYAKSMGTKDDIPIRFDDDLNASVDRAATGNLGALEDQPIGEIASAKVPTLSPQPDSAKANFEIRQALDKIRSGADPRSIGRSSSYEHIEQDRKARLAAAKADNRRRREAIEHSTLEEEAAAYRRGLEDQERRYAAINGDPNYSDPSSRSGSSRSRYSRTSQKSHSREKKQKLSFDTNTGIKDDLHIREERMAAYGDDYSDTYNPINTDSYIRDNYNPHSKNFNNGLNNQPQVLPVNYTSTNQPLYAIIDRQQKLQSGDKVRLRLLENGIYKGQLLPANQILYGICSVGSGRIKIRISSITIQQQLFPTALEVYDLDGMQGIYVEGSDLDIGKEALREGLREASGLGIRNPLGNLSLRIGRKASKKTSARIPSGYQVMLFDRSIR